MSNNLKAPQHRTATIVINQQQLDQIVHALRLLSTAPVNTVDPQYDHQDTFFVSTEDTLAMFKDLNDSVDPNDFGKMVHGFCL